MSDQSQFHPQEQGQYHEPLSSELRPQTDATLTIRIIKSFEFRTQKSMVIKGVNLMEETVGGLMQRVRDCMSFLTSCLLSIRIELEMEGDGMRRRIRTDV
jgi:hypothetical protein